MNILSTKWKNFRLSQCDIFAAKILVKGSFGKAHFSQLVLMECMSCCERPHCSPGGIFRKTVHLGSDFFLWRILTVSISTCNSVVRRWGNDCSVVTVSGKEETQRNALVIVGCLAGGYRRVRAFEKVRWEEIRGEMWQGGLVGPGGRSILRGRKMAVGMGCGRSTKCSSVEKEENQWIKKKHETGK